MKQYLLTGLLMAITAYTAPAQTNITCTDTLAAKIMMGKYNPHFFHPIYVLNTPDTISKGLNSGVSPDSLHAYLDMLESFKNRNTGSDTLSATQGIGAARRWAYSKFKEFSSRNDNRLIPSYLQFDENICGVMQHRDVFAVLPGLDTTDKSIIIIEAHMDSRCTGLCDTGCSATGMEDNGSGTALVMELARVMSRFSFDHTIVFLLTIAEEQGLDGAQAFASYAQQHGIKIKAVLNNDVVGGIYCGHTSSPPGCPGYLAIDSTHVRLFSNGGYNSPHKGLVRYMKLQYNEMIRPITAVPMGINIMTPEDRSGRGGDHIPFRQMGYTSIRLTAQNESGDADVSDPGYADRQHTSADSLGIDADNDGITDTFFVDFNYLARNTLINGIAAGMIGISPATPDFTATSTGGNLIINITEETERPKYRVGIRTTTNDWDTVYTFTGTNTATINIAPGNYILSVASVNDMNVESLFSTETTVRVGPVNATNIVTYEQPSVELLQNQPNPADEATMISVKVNNPIAYKEAYISIRDINGREVKRNTITLNNGINEIMYEHGYNASGTYIYTLVIDGAVIQSKRMVFNN